MSKQNPPQRRLWFWRASAGACLLGLCVLLLSFHDGLAAQFPLRLALLVLLLIALGAFFLTLRYSLAIERQDKAELERLRQDFNHLEAIHENERGRFAALLTAVPDALLLLDAKGRVLEANRAAHALFDRDPVGARLLDLIRAPDVENAVLGTSATQGKSRTLELDLPGPVERHLEVHAIALGAKADAQRLLLLRDATALRRAEALRADFVANASHELRTPLASLQGFIETLQGPAAEDRTAQTRFLAIMRSEAERMARIIGDLLSLSRIELQEHSPPAEICDIDQVVGRVTSVLAPQAEARKVKLNVEGVSGLKVIGSADELVQVLQNLVDNAIKYGREGGRVTITTRHTNQDLGPGSGSGSGSGPGPGTGPARPKRKGVAIAVSDDGEGIAQEHLPRLTERFYRVDKGRSRSLGGTGLGLAIVKHILNRHRGHLAIESAPSRGTTFTVYLPEAK